MRGRTPQLTLHARGVYKTRWAGRDYYFSKDKAASERAFLDPDGAHPGALVHWQAWRARTARPTPRGHRLRVSELARRFLDAYDQDGRPDTESYYTRHLRRFLHALGDRFTDMIDEQHLDAFRADLHKLRPKLAPKTIAHDLGAVKTMWRYGARLKLCPALELSAIRAPRIEQSWPEDIPPEQVANMLARARASGPDGEQLEVWLALCYLCFLRPSECVRLCGREGRFEPIRADHRGPAIPKALFVLKKSKMQHRTRVPRHIVVTDQAMVWLNSAQAKWPTLDSFSKAVRSACGAGGPHILRDSAASHLHSRGAARGEVDLLLGHVPGRVSLSYDQIDWRTLRERAALLAMPSAGGSPRATSS